MKVLLRKIKGEVSYAIGMLICQLPFLRSYKFHLLSSWTQKEKRKGLDNFFYSKALWWWFQCEYLSEQDPDKRESLKEVFMGGQSGKNWAESYDSRPLDFERRTGHLTGRDANPLLPELDKLLSTTTESLMVVQIGSSSGRELAWLAERNLTHKYIGTDIYPEVIDYSSEHHNLPNLSFQRHSSKEISNLLNRYKGKGIIVFASGSLQYVQPEHLVVFFDSLSCIPELQVILLEPANKSQGDPSELKGSLWRGNFSYTHNYRFYAEKANLITQTCRIIRPYRPYEDFPNHRNTVHYFYWAKTGNTPGNLCLR